VQLSSNTGSMVVDFYPVKFADGTISTRQMLKIVTFMGGTRSISMINKKDMQREVDSRVNGYGYEVIGFNTIPQLYNSALACAC
jgi:hypothetical protein